MLFYQYIAHASVSLPTLLGTRGALDFMEFPSHLLERFASDDRVIPLFAKHRDTGAPIPKELLAPLQANRVAFVATDTQRHVRRSCCTLRLYLLHTSICVADRFIRV